MSGDEQALRKALEARGVQVDAVAWDDQLVAWEDFACCIIRSTWDYHLRRGEFTAWARAIGSKTQLWNPPEVIEWNSHKTYLHELEAKGVPIIPTVWLQPHEGANLVQILEEHGWQQVVIKPVVSLYAYHTKRFESSDLAGAQGHLEQGLKRGAMMVQPYMASVETSGERSLIYIDEVFSHAVRRASIILDGAREEARVVEAAEDEIALAQRALAASGFQTLYARVDMTRDDAGDIRLMELEMVEPYLFLGTAEGAVERFAGAIERRARRPEAK